MRKNKKGDDGILLKGKDKGKRGNVLSVTADNRVFVDNVDMVKRHTKANPQRGVAGGIVEKEASLNLSNVALFNPATKKADRVGFRVLEDGRKVRYFKSNDEVVDI